ncbi:MAG: hypothetical protein KKD78_08860 [Proteobacteria bacterium]|nr:hypothetical protein [Pseudomonadota bacterium]MBU4395124.1 hypothetical protein [Pseudomonadota bacterium]
MQQKKKSQQERIAEGFCLDCGVEHSFHEGSARTHCRELMQFMEEEKRIDILATRGQEDSQLTTATLFGEARGKMFGVMVCRAADGSERLLRAFSGQYNGNWQVVGWAPPLFNVEIFTMIYADIEPQIKHLGRELQHAEHGSPRWKDLMNRRKQLSQRWMQEIHTLYSLTNFRGQKRPLNEVFTGTGGIPTGTGDCCAPKLFNQAVKENLQPLGLTEFYWGRENASQTRQHGRFYPSCASKCAPILGFMLCGLDEMQGHTE